MKRRDLLKVMGSGAAFAAQSSAAASAQQDHWPFAANQLQQWTRIQADGFSDAVPGYVFPGDRLEGGVPLGGLGTGYFTLEGSGKLGFCSIYNDLAPPKKLFSDWLTVHSGTHTIPLSAARISYWGHYPVADLQAQFPEIPLTAGIRAFAPFLVGDAAVSNTPAAVFEIELRNSGDREMALALQLAFPPPRDRGSLSVRGDSVIAHDAEGGRYLVNARVPARFTLGQPAMLSVSLRQPHGTVEKTKIRLLL